MSLKPKKDGVSVVVLGSFNPQILTPAWFALNELLPKSAATEAEVNVVHEAGTEFTTDWLHLTCLQSRFQADTVDPSSFHLLRDLVHSVFELLSHTPTKIAGLNRDRHYQLASEKEWHGLGDRIAPKEGWKDILRGRVGLRSLEVEGERSDDFSGYVRIKVAPSGGLKYGVYLQYNDHYDLSSANSSEVPKGRLRDVLANFDDFLSRSDQALESVLRRFQ